MELSRRDVLKGGAIAAMGLTAISVGCAPSTANQESTVGGVLKSGTYSGEGAGRAGLITAEVQVKMTVFCQWR
jgi:tetrahydromethanopterin S-methyltransferase subunit D